MEHMVQIFLTSIVQGITEFLPISSSGHILFLNKIFNWTDVNLTIAVAVHLGTLIAVIKYFWLDIKKYFILGSIETFKTQFTKNRKNTLKSQMFLNISHGRGRGHGHGRGRGRGRGREREGVVVRAVMRVRVLTATLILTLI